MTREEAKIWAAIPRDKLAVIAPHLEKHFETLCAFSGGGAIEAKAASKWFDEEAPGFYSNWEYRVKPAKEAQAACAPKPFYYISKDGGVFFDACSTCSPTQFLFGNCFKTQEEAFAALDRVRAALKGETVSKTETVENKSHVVELSEKLGEPSIAVFHCDGKGGEGGAILRGRGAAVVLDGDKERVLTGLGFLFVSLFRRGFKAGTLEKVLEISTKNFYERGKKIKVEKIEA